MSDDRLKVALVGGPMYDHLYELFADEVEIIVHADHPSLNAQVAAMLNAGARIDVLATHSKYAPSQAEWLQPLDSLLEASVLEALAPGAVELCEFEGRQLCAPRLVDVRILWARSDRVEVVPTTWAELVDSDVRFGFPGRESGLFGTFYELVAGAGGQLFDDDLRPTMDSDEAVAAIEVLSVLARRVPGLSEWHYDEVDQGLLEGSVDLAAAWPGGFGAIAQSNIAEHVEPHPYLAGPARRVSYAGCHAWAIPTTCGDLNGALGLVTRLLSHDAQALDATGGSMCAHVGALSELEPTSELDAHRLELTIEAIESTMITYPPLARFPAIEDAGWSAIRAAILGEQSASEAAAAIQVAALDALVHS